MIMKKNLICLVAFMLLPLGFAVAQPNGEPVDAQSIITDCGTVHQIPKDTPVALACYFVDLYSDLDCGTHYIN